MKCKVCNEEINLSIFGMPDDVCWGCFTDDKKMEVVSKNVNNKSVELLYHVYGMTAVFVQGMDITPTEVVDLETAKHIKKFGFNNPTHHYWCDTHLFRLTTGLRRVMVGKHRMNHNKYDAFVYSAPTKTELIKWIKTINHGK